MKKKKNYVLFGILLVVLCVIGVSYAYWQVTLTQTERNVVTSSCFRITFEDENEIHLQNVYPTSDANGLSLQPYTFTITNQCSS